MFVKNQIMSTEKKTLVNFQAYMTPLEASNYKKALMALNNQRVQNGKKRIYESRLGKLLAIEFTKQSDKVLKFLNYERD